MTTYAASAGMGVGAQLGVVLAGVFFGFLLTGFGWALRRIIIRELDHLSDQLHELSSDFRSWREHSDRRTTQIEARLNLWEVTAPRHPLGRRVDDPPDYDYEPHGGRHEHTA